MKARGWRRGALLGLVLAVALVAAGCGGDDEEPSGAQSGGTAQLEGLITPGTINFSQVTITPERDKVVDFTESYFDANQGVLAKKGTKVASIDDAKKLQWGAQINTTGAAFIADKIQPDNEARIYNTTVDSFQALKAGQIDAVLLDTPIVLGAVEAGQVGDAEVVGQFKTGEVYGAVVNRDSKNLEAFNQVITQMKEDGTRDKLFQQYFAEQAAVPEIPV